MDPMLLFITYRLLIVLGGILCIYFGYRLFYVVKTKQGEFRIKTGTAYELAISDVAPGVFFALFGAGVLVFSLLNGITIKPQTPATSSDSSSVTVPRPAEHAKAHEAGQPPTKAQAIEKRSTAVLTPEGAVPNPSDANALIEPSQTEKRAQKQLESRRTEIPSREPCISNRADGCR
jgi:hypothetical protein